MIASIASLPGYSALGFLPRGGTEVCPRHRFSVVALLVFVVASQNFFASQNPGACDRFASGVLFVPRS